MDIAITTRWNAGRHETGEKMIEEILKIGITHLELGYDTRVDLLPGIQAMQEEGAVTINSVHNYCPVPMGASRGHPEIWTFCDLNRRNHELAVQHTLRTMQYAAEIGAKIVVIHCGYVNLRRVGTRDLMDLIHFNQKNSPRFDRLYMKLLKQREKRAPKHFDQLCRALEALLPAAEELGVNLGLENLPTYEAMPHEGEMDILLRQFPSPRLKYWHDLGHGQIRENLGLINHMRWLETLTPALGGMHIHDVARQLNDHVMPPEGELGLARFKPWSELDIPLVLEPSSRATPDQVAQGLAWVKHWWDDGPEPEIPEPSEEPPGPPLIPPPGLDL
ncbi:MAG: sugar phosphate isomerase/epimerase [Kiritimatiellae bacterium]|nr:sugar phosphate isomerase/epimerase [Kiritimatiellia bacterium]